MKHSKNSQFSDFSATGDIQAPNAASMTQSVPITYYEMSGLLAPVLSNPNASQVDRIKILSIHDKYIFPGTLESVSCVGGEDFTQNVSHGLSSVVGAADILAMRRILMAPKQKQLRIYYIMYRGDPLAAASNYISLFLERYMPIYMNNTADTAGNLDFYDDTGKLNHLRKKAHYTMRVVKKLVVREKSESLQINQVVHETRRAEFIATGTAPAVTYPAVASTIGQAEFTLSRFHPGQRFKTVLRRVFRQRYRNAVDQGTVAEDPAKYFKLYIWPHASDRWGSNYIPTAVNTMMYHRAYSRVWFTMQRGY